MKKVHSTNINRCVRRIFFLSAFVLPLTSQLVHAETFNLQKQGTDYSIDGDYGGKLFQQVYLWNTDADNVNQQWVETDVGSGYHSFRKIDTDMCLDGGSGGERRQPVVLNTCETANTDQHWMKVELAVGPDMYRLEKRDSPEFSIDGDNGSGRRQAIYLWDSSDTNVNQQWAFSRLDVTPTEPPIVEPPVEEPPIVEPPVEEPPIVEPPVEEPPIVEPPVEEPPIVEPPVEIPPSMDAFFVSPEGNDDNAGTLAAPFQTITRARDAVREVNDDMSGDINVYLRGGNYSISDTIEFTEEDSGTNGHSINYQSYNGEEPVLNGATQVSGWTQHSGDIYSATLDRSEKLRTLIVDDERAYMANRTINPDGAWGTYEITAGQADWARIGGSEDDGTRYRLSDLPSVSNAEDIEIMGFTTWNSHIVTVREASVEGSSMILKYSQPYAAIALNSAFGAFTASNGTHTLWNAFEFLDSPGEFYFDRSENTLYYYSDGEDMSNVEVFAPRTAVLMNLEGSSKENRIENVTFSGITFGYTEATLPEVAGSAGKSTVQAATFKLAYSDGNWHNDQYRGFDVMPGAINVSSADSISFEDNTITHIGNEGINFTNDVVNSEFVGNALIDIGGSGINISHPQHVYIGDGGEHEIYSSDVEGVVQDLRVENNLIYDATRMYYGHAAITAFFPNGLAIEQNQIQNTTYTGISLGWGWNNFNEINKANPTTTAGNNKVNNNRIFNVMTLLHDGGALYTLGSQPDSEANGNYVKAPSENFQGVYHPDEGSAWWTGSDLVFEIVPGQDNFELNVWRDKHDNNYDNIFSTSTESQTGAPNSSITNLQVFPDADWPSEALDIIDASGLEPDYQHLLIGIPNPPEVPGL